MPGAEAAPVTGQQVEGVAPVAAAGVPEPLAPGDPVPWPGDAALGALELPDIGGVLATDPEAVVLGAWAAGGV
jgi:hypothetical protein